MTFNQNSVVQSISAASPEALTRLLRQINWETQILGFTASGDMHHCYFRCAKQVVVKDGKIEKRTPGIGIADRLKDA